MKLENINLSEVTIGADPEFFVKRNGHLISGHLFECGTKRQPKPTLFGSVQVDGMALEGNVRPSKTRGEFVSNVRGIVADLEQEINGHPWISKPELIIEPAVEFGKHIFEQTPEEHRKLGCDADYNAWNLKMNPRPDNTTRLRTAAGHIHIGWTKDENPRNIHFFKQCAAVVKQLDYYLGLPSLIWDRDDRRRKLYGKAGAFRAKPYGVEYRVLSNAWISTDKHIGWIFDRAKEAMKALKEGDFMHLRYENCAQIIIDEGDHKWHKTHPAIAKQVLV